MLCHWNSMDPLSTANNTITRCNRSFSEDEGITVPWKRGLTWSIWIEWTHCLMASSSACLAGGGMLLLVAGCWLLTIKQGNVTAQQQIESMRECMPDFTAVEVFQVKVWRSLFHSWSFGAQSLISFVDVTCQHVQSNLKHCLQCENATIWDSKVHGSGNDGNRTQAWFDFGFLTRNHSIWVFTITTCPTFLSDCNTHPRAQKFLNKPVVGCGWDHFCQPSSTAASSTAGQRCFCQNLQKQALHNCHKAQKMNIFKASNVKFAAGQSIENHWIWDFKVSQACNWFSSGMRMEQKHTSTKNCTWLHLEDMVLGACTFVTRTNLPDYERQRVLSCNDASFSKAQILSKTSCQPPQLHWKCGSFHHPVHSCESQRELQTLSLHKCMSEKLI